jgi:hypothetical protein
MAPATGSSKITTRADVVCLQFIPSNFNTPKMLEFYCRSVRHIVSCVPLLPFVCFEMKKVA